MKKFLILILSICLSITPLFLMTGCSFIDDMIDATELEVENKLLKEENKNLKKEHESLITEITTLKFLNKFPGGVITEDATLTNISITVDSEDGIAVSVIDEAQVVIEDGSFNGGQTGFGKPGNSAVWVKSEKAKLIINDGYFTIKGLARNESGELDSGHIDLIYCSKGIIEIHGGLFEGADDTVWLLNCKDDTYKNGTAKIIVKGGTFVNWNPADNKSEGEGTSFVAEGYKVEAEKVDESTTLYHVVKDSEKEDSTEEPITPPETPLEPTKPEESTSEEETQE